jgi:cytochrome c oxidase assembly protein subunit 15
MWLHRYARLVAAATLLLIAAGGMVTSTGSGLAVPDWPTSYGYSMFAFPLDRMVGGIFYEHGHRLIASTVGLLTIGLAVWLWFGDPRRWVRVLGVIALGAVILQGLLGGITVLFFLPASVSIGHAALAQIFFSTTVALALFTSPGWQHRYADAALRQDDPVLRRVAIATAGLVYLQILVGATMRHTGAGLAIPDFPLVFGGLTPSEWTAAIAVHYAHRIGALVVTLAIGATVAHVWHHHPGRRELLRPAGLLAFLVLVQIGLGGWTVLSGRMPIVNTAHVATGALLLATSVVLALRASRALFGDAAQPAPVAAPALPRRSVGARA